jgi:hypothetical protein
VPYGTCATTRFFVIRSSTNTPAAMRPKTIWPDRTFSFV